MEMETERKMGTDIKKVRIRERNGFHDPGSFQKKTELIDVDPIHANRGKENNKVFTSLAAQYVRFSHVALHLYIKYNHLR